jgi:hypothetical protein
MSLIRPLVLLTAIALALYLWVVWDPIGIYGDVRRYLEHPVNFPLEWIIEQYIPVNYQHAAKIVASLYPFVAVVLLLFPGYRKVPQEMLAGFWRIFPALPFVGGLLGLSFWAHEVVIHLPKCPFSAACELKVLFLGFLSLPYLLCMIAPVLTSVLWIPAVLLLLPAFILFAIALLFKLAYFLLVAGVKAPIIIYHSLHYLFVPHPAETAYNAGMARHVPLPELAADVAHAMYQYDMRDYDQLPRAWRSRSWQRRIEAFRNRIRAENDFMQELERHVRLRDRRERS